MPRFHVRVTREIYEYFTVDADTKEQAMHLAKVASVIPFDEPTARGIEHEYTVNADVVAHVYTKD